jgi:large conductance mechanosensitive channel
MWKEFKAFIMRGNVLDLAVAVVIGVAFGKVVSSLVNDVIMPPIGLLLGKVDFSSLYINLSGKEYPSLAAAKAAGAATINYGLFLNAVIDFLIVAAAIFMVVKGVNAAQGKKAEAEPAMKECPYCRSKIAEAASRCPQCTSELAERPEYAGV